MHDSLIIIGNYVFRKKLMAKPRKRGFAAGSVLPRRSDKQITCLGLMD